MERIVGDPGKRLTPQEKLLLAELKKTDGFKVLERITEEYVRGYVVDSLLATNESKGDALVRAQGIAQGARWVIDRVLVSYKERTEKRKKVDTDSDKR